MISSAAGIVDLDKMPCYYTLISSAAGIVDLDKMPCHYTLISSAAGIVDLDKMPCYYTLISPAAGIVDLDKTPCYYTLISSAAGIVDLDKTQMSQMEEENEKLRRRVSELQRENIKFREVRRSRFTTACLLSYKVKQFRLLLFHFNLVFVLVKYLIFCFEGLVQNFCNLFYKIR